MITGAINDDMSGVITIVYDHCDDGELTLHGEVTVNIVDGSSASIEADSYYKKVQISENGRQYSLSGRIHSFEHTGQPQSEITADVVLIDRDTSIQIKLENYSFISCDNCLLEYDESISGRIYHSDHGFVDVSTPQVLHRIIVSDNPEILGQLKFSGASGASMLLTFEEINVVHGHVIDEKKYLMRIELDQDGDQLYEDKVALPSTLAYEYSVYDIGDDDGDGMTNGWERLYGLDPGDSNDASLDADADGFDNHLEFLEYGNPLDSTVIPVIADLSLEFATLTDMARAGRPQQISFLIVNPNPEYGANDLTITLTKTSNVEWGNGNGCAWVSIGPNEMSCHIDHILADENIGASIEVTGEPEEFSLTASLTTATADNDLTNNHDSISATFAQRQANIGLLPDYVTYQNARNDVAVIGYTHVFDIYLSQAGPDDAHESVFRMTLPNNVDVVSADYSVTNVSSGACSVDTEIVCSLGTIYHNAGSTKGYIRIQVTGASEGYGDYTATLTSVADDTDLADNSIHKRMFVGQSLKPIQEQIDNSVTPLTIDIGPGMYVGALDFTGKQVTFNGDAAPGATVIRTLSPEAGLPDNFILSPDSSIRNIYFQGSAFTGGTTNAIYVGGSNVVIENNIFEHNGYNNIGIEGHGDNVTIRNNIFRNSRSIYTCSLISLYSYGSFRIENNLIYDTDCSAIVLALSGVSPDPTKPISHVITNNTIVNNSQAISDSVVLSGSTTKIQNNILVDNQLAIDVSRSSWIENSGYLHSAPQIANNLFFGNTVDESSPINIDLMLFDAGDNLNQDPMFADINNSNYRLSEGSPAIDAGESVDAPLQDIDNAVRPVDGDLDTLLQVDIGAYEYQP